MRSRILSALAAALLAGALTVGCTPTPEPSPTPTGFATEEEAFAAAEETYRAYVDALNAVDLSDPETFEDVYAWTTGEANAGERKSLSRMHADGWSVAGQSLVESVSGRTFEPDDEHVSVVACLNVSAVTLLDANGASQVSSDRPNIQSVHAHLETAETTPTGLVIAKLEGGDQRC